MTETRRIVFEAGKLVTCIECGAKVDADKKAWPSTQGWVCTVCANTISTQDEPRTLADGDPLDDDPARHR